MRRRLGRRASIGILYGLYLRFELIKVFNLLIIAEVKLRKYMKSDEFDNWISKAIIKSDAPSNDARSDGRVPDQPVMEDPNRPPSPGPPCDKPTDRPSSDPEMVDVNLKADVDLKGDVDLMLN